MIEPDWRTLERERVAAGLVPYRDPWICTHGPHDEANPKFSSRPPAPTRITTWHQKFRLRGAVTGGSAA